MSSTNIELTQFLSQQYLCESLTLAEVQTLLDFTELVTCKKNEVIIDIGEVGEALYFVVKGDVALLYEENGQETEIGVMSTGHLMGEMSFFDREPRLLRMRSKNNDTQLLKLPRVMYDRLRIEHPYIAVNILEHAIISLDQLVRRVSQDEMTLVRYMFGRGKR